MSPGLMIRFKPGWRLDVYTRISSFSLNVVYISKRVRHLMGEIDESKTDRKESCCELG